MQATFFGVLKVLGKLWIHINIYMLKINSGNTRTMCEICSVSNITTLMNLRYPSSPIKSFCQLQMLKRRKNNILAPLKKKKFAKYDRF